MSHFFVEQGRTRVFGEAYFLYAATGNPRRTPLSGKMAIYGWTPINIVYYTQYKMEKRFGQRSYNIIG